jgi:hypothetical protein
MVEGIRDRRAVAPHVGQGLDLLAQDTEPERSACMARGTLGTH